jgi:CheY-like chemotaxis protein
VSDRGPGPSNTLLLVDDREDNLRALAAILEPLGHRLVSVTSGQEALKVLLNEEVSVILLDVRMPGMDGYETAAHVKMLERTRDIPIIFLTAEHAESEQALEAFSVGAVDFVAKPFEAWNLRAKVQVFLDLADKTMLLRDRSEQLRQQLDRQYATEADHLRKLTDAALAINSTQSLDDMLAIITDSARGVINTHHAETVITGEVGAGLPARSRSYSPKYEVWAVDGESVDLSALYARVVDRTEPVGMSKQEIAEILAQQDIGPMVVRHPMLEGWLAAPLIGRSGAALGLLQVADKVDGEFTEQDRLVLVQLAQLAAVAIENAQRYHHEHEIAHTLQRSMLPALLASVPGVQLASRYRAGGPGIEVGGDWYDSVVLDDGRLLLFVGDVVGRGTAAAAVMGQLRTGMRAYALQQFPATVLMRSLDHLLQDLGEARFATAVCVVFDPERGQAEVVSAGHPPPLLIGADGLTEFVRCEPHTPLGVLEAPVYLPTVTPIPPGGTLLLYTDGLVEARDMPVDRGMARLRQVVGGVHFDTVEDLCDRVLADIVGEGTGDDVAVLAARLR